METTTVSSKRLKWIAEGLWWLLTAVVVIAVLLPIQLNVPDYPFIIPNIFFIAAFVTFSRYIFFLPISLVARAKWIKLGVIAISAILFFVMTTAISDFRNFLEDRGLQTLVPHLHVTEQTRMMTYMKNQFLFFGTGAIITGILLPMRMIVSLWRMRNRGTV